MEANNTTLIHVNINYELAYTYFNRTREELIVLCVVFFLWAFFSTCILCCGCFKLRRANTPRSSSVALTPAQVKDARPLLASTNAGTRRGGRGL